MHPNERRCEVSGSYGLLHPENDVVAGPNLVVSEVVIEADLDHLSSLKQFDRLGRPHDADPPFWRLALIVEEDLHVVRG